MTSKGSMSYCPHQVPRIVNAGKISLTFCINKIYLLFARSVNGYYTGKIKVFTMVHKCVNFPPEKSVRDGFYQIVNVVKNL